MLRLIRRFSTQIDHIPSLKDFLKKSTLPEELLNIETNTNKPTFHIETYGCQMNESDS